MLAISNDSIRSMTAPFRHSLLFLLALALLIPGVSSASSADLVGDLMPGEPSSIPANLRAAGDYLYFQALDPIFMGQSSAVSLWVSDGTGAGTSALLEQTSFLELDLEQGVVVGSALYFTGLSEATGREIYRVEGEGLEILDLVPGPEGSLADNLAFVAASTDDGARSNGVGDALYFTRETDEGLGLWRLDPYEAEPAPVFVALLRPATAGKKQIVPEYDFDSLYAWGDRVVALVSEDTNGNQVADAEDEEWLWVSDGTAEGTRRIARARHADIRHHPVVEFGDHFFFVGPEEGNPYGEVWVTDGTEAGTGRLIDRVPGLGDSHFLGLEADENAVYFHGRVSQEEGFRVWRTDGTTAGTFILSDRETEHPITVVGDTVYATLRENSGDFALYRFVAGLPLPQWVTHLTPASDGPGFFRVTAAGDRLYYSAYSAESNYFLYSTDGTFTGSRIEGYWPLAPAHEAPRYLTSVGSRVFFSGHDGIAGRELWSVGLRCKASAETQCLKNGRFQLGTSWLLQQEPPNGPVANAGRRVDLTADTGAFTFFDSQTVELAVKVLDGTAINDHFWVFLGSLSNVSFRLDVIDTATGQSRTYRNPDGTFASFGDIEALAVPGAVGGSGDEAIDLAAMKSGALLPLVRSIPGNGEKSEPCMPGADVLCLDGTPGDRRFRLTAQWQDFEGGSGVGKARDLTSNTGGFWFFDPANVELLVKILDARLINDHIWVFLGSLSNVAFTLEVEDTQTGAKAIYQNPQGQFASFGDVEALPSP